MADAGGSSGDTPTVPDGDEREKFVEGLYLGDALRFFLDAKRAEVARRDAL